MYLKALRVKGFKSFARQTELVFEPGVGVIIGPNGSGKSNLADAVIWALGRAEPHHGARLLHAGRHLRRQRRPARQRQRRGRAHLRQRRRRLAAAHRRGQRHAAGHARRLLAVLHQPVQLPAHRRRRAHGRRWGSARSCTRSSARARWRAFLAGKPEDRRSQIEEAAGLGTFKRRRERAELKLREVRRNLERAEMLEREVGVAARAAAPSGQRRRTDARREKARSPRRAAACSPARSPAWTPSWQCAAARWPRSRSERPLRGRPGSRSPRSRAARRRRSRAALAERERRARRLLRARVLDSRLESVPAARRAARCACSKRSSARPRPSATACWPSSPARPEEPRGRELAATRSAG